MRGDGGGPALRSDCAFLCCDADTWGYRVLSVGSALQRWTARVGRDPKRTYVWICSLCLNQHRIGKAVVSPEDLAAEFGPRVQAIGRLLPMLEPWDHPVYLSRAWCLFELYTAIGEHGAVEIDIILTEEQHAAFITAMATAGCESRACRHLRLREGCRCCC